MLLFQTGFPCLLSETLMKLCYNSLLTSVMVRFFIVLFCIMKYNAFLPLILRIWKNHPDSNFGFSSRQGQRHCDTECRWRLRRHLLRTAIKS